MSEDTPKRFQWGFKLIDTSRLYVSIAKAIDPVEPEFVGIVAYEVPIIGFEFKRSTRLFGRSLTIYLLNFYLWISGGTN